MSSKRDGQWQCFEKIIADSRGNDDCLCYILITTQLYDLSEYSHG